MQNTIEATQTENLLTAAQVAERLNLCRIQVFRMAWANELPSIKLGRARRFRAEDVARIMETGTGPIKDKPQKLQAA